MTAPFFRSRGFYHHHSGYYRSRHWRQESETGKTEKEF
jgi:hypothetical protein